MIRGMLIAMTFVACVVGRATGQMEFERTYLIRITHDAESASIPEEFLRSVYQSIVSSNPTGEIKRQMIEAARQAKGEEKYDAKRLEAEINESVELAWGEVLAGDSIEVEDGGAGPLGQVTVVKITIGTQAEEVASTLPYVGGAIANGFRNALLQVSEGDELRVHRAIERAREEVDVAKRRVSELQAKQREKLERFPLAPKRTEELLDRVTQFGRELREAETEYDVVERQMQEVLRQIEEKRTVVQEVRKQIRDLESKLPTASGGDEDALVQQMNDLSEVRDRQTAAVDGLLARLQTFSAHKAQLETRVSVARKQNEAMAAEGLFDTVAYYEREVLMQLEPAQNAYEEALGRLFELERLRRNMTPPSVVVIGDLPEE